MIQNSSFANDEFDNPPENNPELIALHENMIPLGTRLYHIARNRTTGRVDVSYIRGKLIHLIDRYLAGSQSTAAVGQLMMSLQGNYPMSQADMELIKTLHTNHLTDFYCKLYAKLALGIDIDEDVYQLTKTRSLLQASSGTETLPVGFDSGLAGEFDNKFYMPMLDLISYLPDEPAFVYEFNRLVRQAQRSVYFSTKKYFTKVVMPRTLDRCFSVMINEGDFIQFGAEQLQEEIAAGNIPGSILHELMPFNPDIVGGPLPKLEGSMDTYGHGMARENQAAAANVTSLGSVDSEFTPNTIYQYAATVSLLPGQTDFHYITDVVENLEIDFEDPVIGDLAGKINLTLPAYTANEDTEYLSTTDHASAGATTDSAGEHMAQMKESAEEAGWLGKAGRSI